MTQGGTTSVAKIKIPYVWIPRGRTGKSYAYYRRNGLRIPLKAALGTIDFMEEYQRIHQQFEEQPQSNKIRPGSMADLIRIYKSSPEFKSLKPKTKTEYERVITFLQDKCAHQTAATLPRAFVIRLRNANDDSASRANKILAFLKTLMNYAIQLEWRADNPCYGVKKLKLGAGAQVWSADEITAFRDKARPHMRLAFELGLNTGQRLGDVIALPWSSFDGQTITLKQQKTGKELRIPCTRVLQKILTTQERLSPLIVTNASGRPYRRNDSFSNVFGEEVRKCGLNGISFHGLRKTAATILADAGCSDKDIMALTGHETTAMVCHYTKSADQFKRAKKVIAKLDRSGRV